MKPFTVRAPGRVNLIGEHTDYNDGFVLPMAINRWTRITAEPIDEPTVRLWSEHHREAASFSLAALTPGTLSGWIKYAHAVAAALAEHGFALRGFQGVVGGDIPLGAGLSSSASFGITVARAFAEASGFTCEPVEMARTCLRAEQHWIRLNCGIMDQLICACGTPGEALLIDCRSLETRAIPLPASVEVIVLDTGKSRNLTESSYNDREAQCGTAAFTCGVASLRDATPEIVDGALLGPLLHRRARHVVTENARTLAAAAAMDRGDTRELGELMNASHASLRDNYEVSCVELDTIVSLARAQPGCLGARMTGAGFGGCAIALVVKSHVPQFIPAVATAYQKAAGLEPSIFPALAPSNATP